MCIWNALLYRDRQIMIRQGLLQPGQPISDANFDWGDKKPIKWYDAKKLDGTNKAVQASNNAEAEWLKYSSNTASWNIDFSSKRRWATKEDGGQMTWWVGGPNWMFYYVYSEDRLYINTDYFVDDGPYSNSRTYIKREP